MENSREGWRRCAVASLPTLLALLLALGDELPGRPISGLLPLEARHWILSLLATAVCAGAGWVLLEDWKRNRLANVPRLAALAALVALSHAVMGAFDQTADDAYEQLAATACLIVTLGFAGSAVQAWACARASFGWKRWAAMDSNDAQRGRATPREQLTPTAPLRPGARVDVMPGETIPVDAVVVEGSGHVNELLGPRRRVEHRRPGDRVLAGTLNVTAPLQLRVLRNGSQRFFTRIAARASVPGKEATSGVGSHLALAVGALSLSAGLVAYWATRVGHGASAAAIALVATLAVACPHGVRLAASLPWRVAMRSSADEGVLFESGDGVTRLGCATTLLFDEAISLTEGRPRVGQVVSTHQKYDAGRLLGLAAGLYHDSPDAVGRALIQASSERQLTLSCPSRRQRHEAMGLSGTVDGHAVVVGTAELLVASHCNPTSLRDRAARLVEDGSIPLFVAVDGRAAGLIALDDALQPGLAEAMARLKRSGLELGLLSSDADGVGRATAQRAGLGTISSAKTAAEKSHIISGCRGRGKVVAVVGRDPEVLRAADLAIFVGDTGLDAQHSAIAHVVVTHHVKAIAMARRVCQAARRSAKAHLAATVTYNLAGLSLAVGAARPAAGNAALHPMLAALAMTTCWIGVASSASRGPRGRKAAAAR